MNRYDLKLYFAGGTGSSSLGGDRTSSTIQDKSWTPTTPITGIEIVAVDAAAPIGTATLDYDATNTQVRWSSNGNTYGSYIVLSVDGVYDVIDSAGYYISVNVTTTSLPGSDTTATTTVSDVLNSLFDTVTKDQALNGSTDYRAFYFTNAASDMGDSLLSPKLYITVEQDILNWGTASGATSTTLSDTSMTWTADQYKNYFVRLTGGTGAGQSRTITTNTATELTVDTAWATNPSTDTTYEISSSLLDFGWEDIYYEESIGAGDGSTTAFSATLTNVPVLTKEIRITDGTEIFTDTDGDGNLTGDKGGSGTVDYSTGDISVTFNTAPANGVNIVASYNKVMSSVASETTAPSGITFTHPVSADKLDLYSTYDYIRGGGFSQGVWARRKVYRAFDSTSKYQYTITGSF